MVPGGGIFLSLKFWLLIPLFQPECCSSLSACSFYHSHSHINHFVDAGHFYFLIRLKVLKSPPEYDSSQALFPQVRTQHSISTLSLHFKGCIVPEKHKYEIIFNETFTREH